MTHHPDDDPHHRDDPDLPDDSIRRPQIKSGKILGRELSPKGAQRLYSRVVYVRVTQEEWLDIRRRAAQCDLSMSRFLVQASLLGRSPTTRAERDRLQTFLYHFRRASIRLRQISQDRLLVVAGGQETRALMLETADLLERVARELVRRLGEMNAPRGSDHAVPERKP